VLPHLVLDRAANRTRFGSASVVADSKQTLLCTYLPGDTGGALAGTASQKSMCGYRESGNEPSRLSTTNR
jgi:hypothetical protein